MVILYTKITAPSIRISAILYSFPCKLKGNLQFLHVLTFRIRFIRFLIFLNFLIFIVEQTEKLIVIGKLVV